MDALLDNPMVQAGVAPLAVALILAAALSQVRRDGLPWLALAAALATTLALTTGISFTPLSASRKVLLVVLAVPWIGLALDLVGLRGRWLAPALAVALGLASWWVFQSVIAQSESAWLVGGGVALFVALMAGLVLRLRDDGAGGGAATLGLGLAVGVSAVLSASIGTLMNGLAVAAGAGALLLLQFVAARALAPGFTGTLTTAAAAALFAAGTLLLAELRWPALVLMLLVPLVAALPLARDATPRVALVLRAAATAAAALAPIAAAWFATRPAAA